MSSCAVWSLTLLIVAAAVIVAIVCARTCGKTKMEGFTNPRPTLSLMDLTEFTSLPTEFREVIRSSLAKLLGALAVKLNEMYITNPAYVRLTLDQLTNTGIAWIVTFSVPPETATATSATIHHTPSQPITLDPPFGPPPPPPPPSMGGSSPALFQTPYPQATPNPNNFNSFQPPGSDSQFQAASSYQYQASAPQPEPFFGGGFAA